MRDCGRKTSVDISADRLLLLYTTMLRIRLFEERIAALYPEQEMHCPVHLCIGQEAIAAGVCAHLRREDYIFSTHRSHGHCIAKGMAMKSIAAELYGKSTGCSRGRGGSMHLADPGNGIPGTSAIVGGCIPLAAGAALASKMRGEGKVSIAFFGDGAVDEGVFHESLNFASLKKLPVIFVCENNSYATNSPQTARQPDVLISDRAAGYGIPGVRADGNDVLQVYRTAGEAVDRALRGDGPALIEYVTYRWKAHVGPNSDIGAGCRSAEAHEEWLKRCPLAMFDTYLDRHGILSETGRRDIRGAVEHEVDEAVTYAKNSPYPDPAGLLEHVY